MKQPSSHAAKQLCSQAALTAHPPDPRMFKEDFRIFDKKKKVCQNLAPAGTRHPKPYLKKFPGFCQTKKSLYFSVLLVLSSWSFKEPGQQDEQDGEKQTLDSGEMKVCISGLTLTQNPNPQKNKSYLKGLGFRVRVSPEKQTFEFGGNESLLFWPTPPRTTHPLEDDSL